MVNRSVSPLLDPYRKWDGIDCKNMRYDIEEVLFREKGNWAYDTAWEVVPEVEKHIRKWEKRYFEAYRGYRAMRQKLLETQSDLLKSTTEAHKKEQELQAKLQVAELELQEKTYTTSRLQKGLNLARMERQNHYERAQKAEEAVEELQGELQQTNINLQENKAEAGKLQEELEIATEVIQDLSTPGTEAFRVGRQMGIIEYLKRIEKVVSEKSAVLRKEILSESLEATLSTFEGSIDFLRTIVEAQHPKQDLLCLFDSCGFSCDKDKNKDKTLAIFFEHLHDKHSNHFTVFHAEFKAGIYQVIEGTGMPDWCGNPVARNTENNTDHKFETVQRFRKRFLRLCSGSESEFTCKYICAGERIDSVQDFLKHFDRFHPDLLRLINEDIIAYIRQPHVQATPFGECEHVMTPTKLASKQQKAKMQKSGPASVSNHRPGVKTKVDQLARATAINVGDLLLKNKRLEFDLSTVQKKLTAYEMWYPQVRACFRVGAAICNRKMQKQLPQEDQDQEIIELGDFAAHHGTPNVDSSLFLLKNEAKGSRIFEEMKPSEEGFKILYGLPPSIVSSFADNPNFLRMVGFRGSMKAFKGKLYEKTEFNQKFLACIDLIKDVLYMWPTPEAKKALAKIVESEQFITELKLMEEEHDIAEQENKDYRSRRVGF